MGHVYVSQLQELDVNTSNVYNAVGIGSFHEFLRGMDKLSHSFFVHNQGGQVL